MTTFRSFLNITGYKTGPPLPIIFALAIEPAIGRKPDILGYSCKIAIKKIGLLTDDALLTLARQFLIGKLVTNAANKSEAITQINKSRNY